MQMATSIDSLGVREDVCDKHGAFTSTGNRVMSREFWTTCQKCESERLENFEADEARQRQEDAERFVERALSQSGIPLRFRARGFGNFVAKNEGQKKAEAIARAFLYNWPETAKRGDFLIFQGNAGTGKTHLACAIAHNLLRQGYTAAYMNAIDAIRVLRDTWRRDSEKTETQALETFERLDLLVLDEIGVQFSTDAERTQLFDILNRRYRECRPTILLTNLDLQGIETVLGERTFDRFREVATVVAFDWESQRKRAST
jgi:DNA replication protein DnaC